MGIAGSMLRGEPSKEDYDRADEYVRRVNARDGIPPERKALLMEFPREIARTYQAEREMAEYEPGSTER